MKILHIIPSFHGGGAEKFCIDLCNELSKEHDVTICSLFPVTEEMFMAKALDSRIRVVILNKKPGLDISIFFKLFNLIRDGNFDIVNTHLRALAYSSLAIAFTKTKFFHTVHNMADKEMSPKIRILYNLLFRFMNVKPIGISKQVMQSIQREYGIQFNVLIENGVKQPVVSSALENVRKEIESYKKTSGTKVFLAIGRITVQKNHIMLVEVYNQLIEEGEDVVLLIIGDDPVAGKPLLHQLGQMAKRDIYFLGMKQNIADYLICSDAFCLSSLYEGLPIALLEAMSLGIIPICTPAGGIVDVIIDGENGWLSKDFSKDAFYKAIKKYLYADEATKSKVSFNSKQTYDEKYSIVQTSKNYMNIYRSI
ncbi:MAG: glycosyltransferase [Epsilonproteobacteria bacterium]|nr:glycosyltransferase [Campylobacterota bacterium]